MDKLRERIEREDLTDENRAAGLVLLRRSADLHNAIRRRGVPIIGRAGAGGAIPGSDPAAALLRKEALSDGARRDQSYRTLGSRRP